MVAAVKQEETLGSELLLFANFFVGPTIVNTMVI